MEITQKIQVIPTGGGCEAYYYASPFGRSVGGYFLVTALDGATLPKTGEKAIVGWYKDDGEFIDSIDTIFY
jgi:hypothetical protein